MITARQLLIPTAALLFAACAPATQHSGNLADTGNGVRIEDEAIGAAHGTLLNSIQNRMAGMSLSRGAECPRITFRGPKSVMLDTNPLVYISGQRAANTCVLETINSDDVSSIEVYPNGVTRRAGYQSAAGGLILVFMKDGTERT